MRDAAEITRAVEAFADTVLRVCALYHRSQHDREDAFQETFLKYAQSATVFADDEHRKAWLIRVATNVCKDQLKAMASKNVPLSAVGEETVSDERLAAPSHVDGYELADALQRIEHNYRIVLFLKYYEGYTAPEIASMLGMPENTVYTNLARGREKLKEVLAHDDR